MSVEMLAAASIRWLDIAAFAVLCGATALEFVVLPHVAAKLGAARARLRRMSGLAAAGMLVAGSGELLVRARAMAGGDLSTALAALPVVLTRTHFGKLWIARCALLLLLAALAGAKNGRARWLAPPAIALVALTTALTGHAADRGDLSWESLADWAHVVASAAWTGGLLALACLPWRDAEAAGSLGAIARRFSRLAGLCLAAVVASGIVNLSSRLPTVAALWTTSYGQLLAGKLTFVLALVGLGAWNRYRIVPSLASARDSDAGACAPLEAHFRHVVAAEALLAVIVFACTALLVETSPPHAGAHAEHLPGGVGASAGPSPGSTP